MLSIILIIFCVFTIIGTNTKISSNSDIRSWSYDILLEANFNPPPMIFMDGATKNSVKIINGEAYIYLVPGSEEQQKREMLYLMSYLVSDSMERGPVYYSNLEILMDVADIS